MLQGVDCDANAACTDTSGSYECRCNPGYSDVSETYALLPGRKCIQTINECEDKTKNDCSENAICTDAKDGFVLEIFFILHFFRSSIRQSLKLNIRDWVR